MSYTTNQYSTKNGVFARFHFKNRGEDQIFWESIQDRFYRYGQNSAGYFLVYRDRANKEHIICASGDLEPQAKMKLITVTTYNNRKDPRVQMGSEPVSDINEQILPRVSLDPGNVVEQGGNWWFIPKRNEGGGGIFGKMTPEKLQFIKSKPINLWHKLLNDGVKVQLTNNIAEGISQMSLHHGNSSTASEP